MKIAVVGATGLVGREILKVIEERNINPEMLIPVASQKSVGSKITFAGKEMTVVSHEEAVRLNPRVAVFSAGASVSKQWAPVYAEAGITVIDNSSAWRMFPGIPLIVPEINAHILTKADKIIANPNCSTIQLVMVLAPLEKAYGINRVIASTYQSVTGTGAKAVRQLENERNGIKGEMAYPHPIDLNLFPHGGDFQPDGYTSEEVKLVNETRKILDTPEMLITATIVRVPVFGGHSEAVTIELKKQYNLEDIRPLLERMPGIIVTDDPKNNVYPMPILARGKDEVFVGRIRRDHSAPNSLNLFIVADNLRKGAATNAIQIALYLESQNIL
jgi:aspartate-semialdehyde dehydrogenase